MTQTQLTDAIAKEKRWLEMWREAEEAADHDGCDTVLHFARSVESAVLSRATTRVLPNPGSPEASAMMDSVLAEYNWPANSKNAARAGWEAANRWLGSRTTTDDEWEKEAETLIAKYVDACGHESAEACDESYAALLAHLSRRPAGAAEGAMPTDAQLAAGAFYPQVHGYAVSAQTAAPAPADLHNAIMNLPCRIPPMVIDDQAYKLGHRDARHAAAELAAALSPSPSGAAVPPDLLAIFTEWARQVSERADVPQGIRYAAAQLHKQGMLAASPTAPAAVSGQTSDGGQSNG